MARGKRQTKRQKKAEAAKRAELNTPSHEDKVRAFIDKLPRFSDFGEPGFINFSAITPDDIRRAKEAVDSSYIPTTDGRSRIQQLNVDEVRRWQEVADRVGLAAEIRKMIEARVGDEMLIASGTRAEHIPVNMDLEIDSISRTYAEQVGIAPLPVQMDFAKQHDLTSYIVLKAREGKLSFSQTHDTLEVAVHGNLSTEETREILNEVVRLGKQERLSMQKESVPSEVLDQVIKETKEASIEEVDRSLPPLPDYTQPPTEEAEEPDLRKTVTGTTKKQILLLGELCRMDMEKNPSPFNIDSIIFYRGDPGSVTSHNYEDYWIRQETLSAFRKFGFTKRNSRRLFRELLETPERDPDIAIAQIYQHIHSGRPITRLGDPTDVEYLVDEGPSDDDE